MKYLALGLLLVSFNALACWKVEGQLAVDGETFKFHQKIDHDKEYVFPMGTFILKFKIASSKTKTHPVTYTIHEKKGLNLTLVSQGSDEVKEKESQDIYAKGETGQPNSILTFKLENI